MMEIIGAIVSASTVIIGIGMLIFVHGLGHFLVAKEVGIRVEAFSLGFGPRLFGFKRDETDYKVCVIPLGGYVKMAGESMTEIRNAAPGDFGSKTIAQRAWVVSAGVIMNVIFALVAFPIAFALGVTFISPDIGNVVPGGPAWQADIRPGDKIVRIDGTQVISFEDIQTEIAFINRGESADFDIVRGGRTIQRRVTPRFDAERGINVIDIQSQFSVPTFKDDYDGLKTMGISGDDEIIAVNGMPTLPSDLRSLLQLEENFDPSSPVELVVRAKDGTTRTVRAIPDVGPMDDENAEWMIGVALHTNKVKAVVSSGENNRGEPTVPEELGLRVGDVVVAVGGIPVHTERDVRRAILDHVDAPSILLGIDPAGLKPGEDVPRMIEFMRPDRARRLEFLQSVQWTHGSRALRVLPGSPAEAAGLKSGDVLFKCDGRTLAANNDRPLEELRQIVQKSGGKSIALTVQRGEDTIDVQVTPVERKINRWSSHLDPARPMTVKHREGLLSSLSAGFHQTVNQGKKILMSIKGFLTGNVGSKNVGGIIFIATASYSFAEQGLAKVLFFFAILSLNLAVLNILPIPVLDGGHLVFLLIEKVKGGPLSERAMGYATWTGLALLLALMVFATFNDIRRLIS